MSSAQFATSGVKEHVVGIGSTSLTTPLGAGDGTRRHLLPGQARLDVDCDRIQHDVERRRGIDGLHRQGHAVRLAVRLLGDALQLDIERGERFVLQQQARLALLFQRPRLVDADAAIDGEGRKDGRRRPGPPASARGEAPSFTEIADGGSTDGRGAASRSFRAGALGPPVRLCARPSRRFSTRLGLPGRQLPPQVADQRVLLARATAWRDGAVSACPVTHGTTAPLAMWTICSAWSARRKVVRNHDQRHAAIRVTRRNWSMISLSVSASRSEVGSSASSSAGSLIRARAIAARRCSPAEISAG